MKRRLTLSQFRAAAGRRGALVVCVVLCTVGLAFSQSDRKVRIVTFDAPGAGTGTFQGTFGSDINPEGAIAGSYIDASGVYHGLLRTPDGTIIESDQATCALGNPGVSINPAGSMIGFCAGASSVYHGFVRPPDGTITWFDAPGAGTGAGQGTFTALGMGISPTGAIAGDFLDANNVYHAFLRAPDGVFTTFEAPGAGTGAFQGTLVSLFHSPGSGGMNPEEMITGTYVDASDLVHGFLRAPDGTFTTFDAPGAGRVIGSLQGTYPASINPARAIAGAYYDDNNVAHGFLRARDGSIAAFDVPGAGTGPFQGTFALAINPAGTITGTYVDGNSAYHGFLRAPDGAITTFDPAGAGTGPGQGTLGYSINSEGVIAGAYLDASNVWHGFLR